MGTFLVGFCIAMILISIVCIVGNIKDKPIYAIGSLACIIFMSGVLAWHYSSIRYGDVKKSINNKYDVASFYYNGHVGNFTTSDGHYYSFHRYDDDTLQVLNLETGISRIKLDK